MSVPNQDGENSISMADPIQSTIERLEMSTEALQRTTQDPGFGTLVKATQMHALSETLKCIKPGRRLLAKQDGLGSNADDTLGTRSQKLS